MAQQKTEEKTVPLGEIEWVGDHVIMPTTTFDQLLERLCELEGIYKRRSWWRP